MWLDDGARAIVLETVACAPKINLFPPSFERNLVRLCFARLELFDEFDQYIGDTADNGDIYLDPFRDRRGVNVDMYDLAVFIKKVFGVADHTVIKTGADSDEYVTMLHRHIGFVGAVHSQHADRVLVCGWKSSQAHQCVGTWESQHPDQFG